MRSFHIDPLAFSFPQEMCVLQARQSSRAGFMAGRLNRLGRLVEIASLSLHVHPDTSLLDLISCVSSVHLGEEEEEEKGQAAG